MNNRRLLEAGLAAVLLTALGAIADPGASVHAATTTVGTDVPVRLAQMNNDTDEDATPDDDTTDRSTSDDNVDSSTSSGGDVDSSTSNDNVDSSTSGNDDVDASGISD